MNAHSRQSHVRQFDIAQPATPFAELRREQADSARTDIERLGQNKAETLARQRAVTTRLQAARKIVADLEAEEAQLAADADGIGRLITARFHALADLEGAA